MTCSLPSWGHVGFQLLTTRAQNDERDYVREEIAAALTKGIVVIPVRAGREGSMTPLPRAQDLPGDIRDLVLHQKHDVAHERFRRDIADLIASIEIIRRGDRRPVPWGLIAAGAIAMIAAVAVASSLLDVHAPWTASTEPTSAAPTSVFSPTSAADDEVQRTAPKKAEEEKKQYEAIEANRRAEEAAAAETKRKEE